MVDLPNWTDIWAPLIVTMIGTVAGFVIALYHDRWAKKKEQNENIGEAIMALKTDLEQTKEWAVGYLKDKITWVDSSGKFEGEWPILSFPSYKSTVDSGIMSLFPSHFQMSLHELNSRIETITKYADQILNFHLSPIYTDVVLGRREAERITGKTNEGINKMIDQIDYILKDIIELLKRYPAKELRSRDLTQI